MQVIEKQESQGRGNNEAKEEERPIFVKSSNFKHSSKMDPKNYNEPPTDRQIKYMKNLGYAGAIPKNRKEASDIIGKLLGQGMAQDIKCKNCGNLTKKANSKNGYCFLPKCRKAQKAGAGN